MELEDVGLPCEDIKESEYSLAPGVEDCISAVVMILEDWEWSGVGGGQMSLPFRPLYFQLWKS